MLHIRFEPLGDLRTNLLNRQARHGYPAHHGKVDGSAQIDGNRFVIDLFKVHYMDGNLIPGSEDVTRVDPSITLRSCLVLCVRAALAQKHRTRCMLSRWLLSAECQSA